VGKIIALDFDGCLCDSKYPECGEPVQSVVDAIKAEQAAGAKIILWTSCSGDALAKAEAWCKKRGLHFDAVNKNVPEKIEFYGDDTRKVSADEYLDDKAVLKPEKTEDRKGLRLDAAIAIIDALERRAT
jgi:hypothetical protein